MKPYIRVLGSAGWRPTKNNDYSCYTVSDSCLIDVCAAANQTLLNQDVDPASIDTVLFTHMHFDHHAGLGPLLYYNRVIRKKDLSGLTIYGPKDTMKRSIEQALMYVFHTEENIHDSIDKMPRLVELSGSGCFDIPGYHVEYIPSQHAAPGLCYRMTHLETGHSIGFTGDTRYFDDLPSFFSGVDTLVHEASFGSGPVDEVANEGPKHSSAREASKVCTLSGAKKMLLTHSFVANREASVNVARELTEKQVEWAVPGNIYEF